MEQLDEDAVGSTVTLLGHVNEVTERYTRDNRKFLRVDLGMVGGQVETMVWPDNLEKTAHVWQQGATVRVVGRLQVRAMTSPWPVSMPGSFRLESRPGTPPAGTPSAGTPSAGEAGRPHAGPSRDGAGNPTRANGHGNGNGAPAPASPAAPVGGRDAGMLIRMTETDDADGDRYLLRQAIRVMLEYTGDDKVYVELNLQEGRRVLMEVPTVSTDACPELQQRLLELLGEATPNIAAGNCRRRRIDAPPSLRGLTRFCHCEERSDAAIS